MGEPNEAYEKAMAEIRRRSEVMAEPQPGWYTSTTRPEAEPFPEDPEPVPDDDEVA